MTRSRVVFAAAGACGAAVLISTGPLEPPAGPVAPTSPSLADLASLIGADDGLIRPIDAPGMDLIDSVRADIRAPGYPFDGDLSDYDDFRLNVAERRCRLIKRVRTNPLLIQQTTSAVGVDDAIDSIELRILEMGEGDTGPPITISGVTLDRRRIEVGNGAIEVYDYSFDTIMIGGAR